MNRMNRIKPKKKKKYKRAENVRDINDNEYRVKISLETYDRIFLKNIFFFF